MPQQKKDMASTMSSLTIEPHQTAPASSKKNAKAKQPVADSWEDEDLSSPDDNDGETTPTDPVGSAASSKGTSAPPPTPISPTYRNKGADGGGRPWSPPTGGGAIGEAEQEDDEDFPRRRPEKTDAVARRLIAGALGIKAPKQTEEQKAYERAVREQERKRLDEQKAAEKKRLEEVEKAKAAMWDD